MNIIKLLNFLEDYESFFIGTIIGQCFIATLIFSPVFLLGLVCSIILAMNKLRRLRRVFIKDEKAKTEVEVKARLKMPTLEWKTKKRKKLKAKE